MALLVAIGLLAGAVTAISPCVLPVVPLVLADAALGSRRRALLVVAGLVCGFTGFTLGAAFVLDALRLPAETLRDLAVAVVLAAGLGLAFPRVGELLARPFRPLGRHRPSRELGGLLYGASLALLFTPCAGPVLAAIAAVAATRRFSLEAVAVTTAFAAGAGAVLLTLAIAGRRLAGVRAGAPGARRALGLAMAAVGVAIALGMERPLARLPDYAAPLRSLEHGASAARSLQRVRGVRAALPADALDDFGPAPGFRGVSTWINSAPRSLQSLRGRVVLVDFWTYSCLACLHTLPELRAWNDRYAARGLVVVGVHTPEFAFEHDVANVRRSVQELGVRWPVALDPRYATWNAWGNDEWPSEYLVDRGGRVRYFHRGEGGYAATEAAIRSLLAERRPPPPLRTDRLLLPPVGAPGSIVATPPSRLTPETYLGSRRRPDRVLGAVAPSRLPLHSVALGGRWRAEPERVVAAAGARLLLRFRAHRAYAVLAGRGTVRVTLDGRSRTALRVDGDRAYRLVQVAGPAATHLLELRLSPGLAAYTFTFD